MKKIIKNCKNFLKKCFDVKNKKQFAVSVIIAIVILSLLSAAVYAAFIGAGHRKGVAVANGYYFTSNVLSQMNSATSTPVSYSCIENGEVTNLSINVQNFSNSLIPDPFDVEYTLKCQLIGTGTNYTYKLVHGTDVYTIGSTPTELTGLVLGGSENNTDNFTLTFTHVAGDELLNVASVRITAIPTSPSHMKHYYLGADISLSASSTPFAAVGTFDNISAAGSDINNLAGFLYHVTTSGNIPNGQTGCVTLQWDFSHLELDDQNEYLALGEYAEDSASSTATLRIPIGSGEYMPFTFFRPDGFTSDIDPYNEITLSYETIAA